jgi:hypothetical protein
MVEVSAGYWLIWLDLANYPTLRSLLSITLSRGGGGKRGLPLIVMRGLDPRI